MQPEEHSQVFTADYGYYGSEATAEDFQNRYIGQYESEADFVYEQEELGKLKWHSDLGVMDVLDWLRGDRPRLISSWVYRHLPLGQGGS